MSEGLIVSIYGTMCAVGGFVFGIVFLAVAIRRGWVRKAIEALEDEHRHESATSNPRTANPGAGAEAHTDKKSKA